MAEHPMFTNNSNKAKQAAEENKPPERKHATPIAKRIQKKDTLGQKFKNTFLAEDVDDIGDYMLKDLVIPTMKDVLLNFIEAALNGTRRPGGLNRGNVGSGVRKNYTTYDKPTSSRIRSSRRDYDEEPRERSGSFELLNNLTFATRAEAEGILEAMEDYIDEYDAVPAGYLYELMNESGPYTVEYFGWKDLSRARISHGRAGYTLQLPRPVRMEGAR